MHKIRDFYKAYIKAIKEINSEREEGEVWLSLLKTLTYEKKDIVDAFDNVGENLAAIAKYFSKDDYEKYVKGEASNLTYAEKIKIDELMKRGEE